MQALRQPRLDAAALGELCLAHLAESPERLARFMEVAGYDPAGLRKAVGSEHLARGLIDYFAANEALMLALCAGAELRPEDFMRVWYRHNRAN